MQLREWLRRNGQTAQAMAAYIKVSPWGLYRCMSGSNWPPAAVLIKVHLATAGEVTFWDWVETCREVLIRDGIIQDGEHFHGEKTQGVRIPGVKPGRKTRKAARIEKQDGEPAA